MPCKFCKARGQTWSGDAPKCAFEESKFNKENWNCATMNLLRGIGDEILNVTSWFNDSSITHVPLVDYGFIVLTWYKNRGRTGNAFIAGDDNDPTPLYFKDAEETILKYKQDLIDLGYEYLKEF